MYESEPIHSPISEERKSIEDGIKLLTGESLSTPMASRLEKFTECLCAPNVDMTALRELSWRGIPAPARPIAWRLLLGYLPQNRERRITMLRRKRAEYWYVGFFCFYIDMDYSQTTLFSSGKTSSAIST